MNGLAIALALVMLSDAPVRVGAKSFTESVLLAEIATTMLRARGVSADPVRELGGTAIAWRALLAGEIDVYPEYTGTLRMEVLSAQHVRSDDELRATLRRLGIDMLAPLGFENTYRLGVRRTTASDLSLVRISDLAAHPELRFGLSNEFLSRRDGWPGLKSRYGLTPREVRGLEHDLAYEALRAGVIDVVDVYTTDPQIMRDHIAVLADDRGYFVDYAAVLLVRSDLAERVPAAARELARLSGAIDVDVMRSLNARAQLQRVSPANVAAMFVRTLGIAAPDVESHDLRELARHLRRHLALVGLSLAAAILLAVPLGVACAYLPRVAGPVLAVAGALQTLPSLALLVLMIPLFGIGFAPAAVALFAYSLLPIVENTFAGLASISRPLRESAMALGLTPVTRLLRVDLPLASPSILAGVRTAAVINVGTATLGALVGAGGLGEPILTGVRLGDTRLVLMGAVPAALLALVAQSAFGLVGRVLIPKALRQPHS